MNFPNTNTYQTTWDKQGKGKGPQSPKGSQSQSPKGKGKGVSTWKGKGCSRCLSLDHKVSECPHPYMEPEAFVGINIGMSLI